MSKRNPHVTSPGGSLFQGPSVGSTSSSLIQRVRWHEPDEGTMALDWPQEARKFTKGEMC